MKNNPKILILGGGLAGTTLAWRCFYNEFDFLLFDLQQHKASEKAAGIFNPVVFRRLTKSWMVDEAMPVAKGFYQKVEMELNTSFFFEIPLQKALSEIEEINQWEGKIGESNFENYLHPTQNQIIEGTKNFKAWGKVKQAGWVDLKTYLSKSHEFFEAKGLFRFFTDIKELNLNLPNFKPQTSNLSIEAKKSEEFKIIHCTGPSAANDPLWSYLPWSLTKGETLTIKASDLKTKNILKKHYFILPLGNDFFRVGATYNWNHLDWQPSNEGKSVLIEKLEEIIDCPYEIVKQEAGIRPTTRARRPFLGEHPTEKGNYIFNGLGSKGVMLAPLFSDVFFNYLSENQPLPKELDINQIKLDYE